MKKYNFFKTDGKMPSQEQLLDTQLFYQNAPEIYARFDEWKDIDRVSFIPLHLQMTYSCGWKGFESVTGWRIRATVLRDQVASDKGRYRKFRSEEGFQNISFNLHNTLLSAEKCKYFTFFCG